MGHVVVAPTGFVDVEPSGSGGDSSAMLPGGFGGAPGGFGGPGAGSTKREGLSVLVSRTSKMSTKFRRTDTLSPVSARHPPGATLLSRNSTEPIRRDGSVTVSDGSAPGDLPSAASGGAADGGVVGGGGTGGLAGVPEGDMYLDTFDIKMLGTVEPSLYGELHTPGHAAPFKVRAPTRSRRSSSRDTAQPLVLMPCCGHPRRIIKETNKHIKAFSI